MMINTKRAGLQDINQLAGLFDAYRVFYQQKSDVDVATDFIRQRLSNKESVIFIALDENAKALGFTQLYPSFSSVSAHKMWILNDLFVASSARRLGVGKKLMQAAKNFALASEAKGITLETAEDNVNAQALYQSLGYKKASGVYHYYLALGS